jgi:hypothetical protein
MAAETGTWTRIATAGGVLCGLGELALAPSMDGASGKILAAVFGLLFLAGAVLVRRGRIGGAILVAVLAAVELAFMPMYTWSSARDWIPQGLFAAASVVALVGGIGVVVERRRSVKEALVTG